MTRPGAYLQLMRPVNLGILLLLQLLLLGKGSGWNTALLRWPECLWLAWAILSAAAAGNVVNDLLDTATDAINKPEKQLIPERITRTEAWRLYALLVVSSLLSAWFVDPGFFIFCCAISILLRFYTSDLKGIPLAGNILVAMLTAAAVFSLRLGLYDTTRIPFAELSALAFFVNLARELVKDVEDLPGDGAAGIRTIAVCYGIDRTMQLASLALLPAFILAAVPVFLAIDGLLFRLHYLIAALAILWISIAIYRNRRPEKASTISLQLKLLMLYGLLGMLWL